MKRSGAYATLILAVGLLVAGVAPVQPEQQPSAADRFEVSDVMIPTRDGTRLHTKVFVPRNQSGPLPIIVKRTPYGIEGSAGNFNAYFKALEADGYIFVFQDIRGKFGSEGQFMMQRPARAPGDTKSIDEGTDTYDSIDCEEHPQQQPGRHAGRVADGWTMIMGAIEPHPALKRSPQASPADMWMGDDYLAARSASYGFPAAMMEAATSSSSRSIATTFDWA